MSKQADQQHQAGFWARRLTSAYSVGVAGLVGLGATWYRLRGPSASNGLRQRFGDDLPPRPAAGPIWIHASSMGEVRVAGLFAHELRQHGAALIASAMTETGFNLIPQVFPEGTAPFRMPFDIPGPIQRTLAHFKPAALVLIETEWWPNLLLHSAEAGVPIFVVNGRLSERSFARYRLGRPYWRQVLRAVELFYMRSEPDALRVRRLGVDAGRTRVIGAIKAVDAGNNGNGHPIPPWVEKSGGPLWIAGCTRPGEEDLVLEAWAIARQSVPDLRLWIAPRHPDRFAPVARLLEQRGHVVYRWSEHEADAKPPTGGTVVLIDRLGILASLYRYADVSFIGGSLQEYGGHSPLEPALAGAPVTFGPHMDEQRDAADLLLANGLAREVWGPASLAIALLEFLDSPSAVGERQHRIKRLLETLTRNRAEVARDLIARIRSPRN
ncbi:MAG: glycosyltransferase N-terminal domain-containing protein [Candidatus Zixiibacteriota bacterium]